jgi:hypothetical protein
MPFSERLAKLECAFARQAEADGAVYLPNFSPSGPVDAILVAMEPSFHGWAGTAEEARAKVKTGFRNFMSSIEDFILHYSVRRFLCRPGETYHITDVSKGAMTVASANIDRQERYDRWALLIEEELDLIAKPSARIVAIGKRVSDFLNARLPGRQSMSALHYSPQAARARGAAVRGREAEFRSFAQEFAPRDLLAVAETVMIENDVPLSISEPTLRRLRTVQLTDSRKKLAFIYKTTFSGMRG